MNLNIYFYYGIQTTIKGYEGLVKRSAPLVFDIKGLNYEMYRQAMHLSMYAGVQEQSYLKLYRDSVIKCEELSIAIDKNLTTPEGKKQFSDVKKQYDLFRGVMEEYITAADNGNLSPQLRLKVQTVIEETGKQMAAYSDFLAGRMVLRTDQNKERVAGIVQNIILAIVALVIIALIAATFFARLIAKPLQQVAAVARRIAENDLSAFKVEYKGNDEIKDLIVSFEDMVDGLRATIVGIMRSADELAQASFGLNDNAQQTAETANQIAISATNIAHTRAEQFGYFEKASTSAQHMNDVVYHMATTVNNVVGISKQSSQASVAGQIAVKEAETQMERINSAVEESTHVISLLGESSQKVGDIIGVISDIASQTNLLALNAAIEAARAGEHGRGFAVVAEEVRKLAEQVAQSTQEISAIIAQIQNETKNAVQAMQIGSAEVEKGAVVISTTGERFAAISDLINLLQQEIEDIKAETEKMGNTSDDVGDAIGTVKNLADKSTNDSQTIGASTEEQSATMQEVSAASRKLATLADNLKQLVAKFKIV